MRTIDKAAMIANASKNSNVLLCRLIKYSTVNDTPTMYKIIRIMMLNKLMVFICFYILL